jgi:hypothetical protein
MDSELTPDSTLTNETSLSKPSESELITDTEYRSLTSLGDRRQPNPALWKPGQSGNPLGKPKGTKNRITLLKLSLEQYLREEAADHMGEILQTAIKKAKKGDNQMIKLLLELHMSKTGDLDDKQADDKITININSMEKPAINITPAETEEAKYE